MTLKINSELTVPRTQAALTELPGLGQQVQMFAPKETDDPTYFRPDAALLERIEKDCDEVERHLNEFKRRGIAICTHVARIREAFRIAGRSSDEFCSYMQGRFIVERSTIMNYLRVGRCLPLRDLDVDLSKLHALSTLAPVTVAKVVKEIGRESLGSMTVAQVKEIVKQQKGLSERKPPAPGDNSMLAAKTLKNILNRIDGLIDILGPYVGIARDLRAADEIDIIGQMRELEMTLSKILDTEPRPIPHKIAHGELDYDGLSASGLSAPPPGSAQAPDARKPDEPFDPPADTSVPDASERPETIDVSKLGWEDVAAALEGQLLLREPNPFLNEEGEHWGFVSRLIVGPRAGTHNHGSGQRIFIQYHHKTRNSLVTKITLKDARLYLKWLIINPNDFLTYPDFVAR